MLANQTNTSLAANANGGSDTISFNIPISDAGYRDFSDPDTPSSGNSSGGDDYWTIRPATVLPTITDTTILDATVQTTNQLDTNTNGPEIEIKGTGTSGINCLSSNSTDTIIKGFVVNNCAKGIIVAGTNPTVSGNYVGVDIKGTTMISNQIGIDIQYTTNGLIGGLNLSDRNIIAGNKSKAIVFSGDCLSPTSGVNIYNNYLNVDRTGTTAIVYNVGNYGIYAAYCKTNITVGDGTVAGRNLIASVGYGIQIQLLSNNWHIKGNYFGFAADGTTLLSPVYSIGIAIDSGSHDNTIGGTNIGDKNFFADAGFATIWIWDDLNTSNNQVLNNYICADINGDYKGSGNSSNGVVVGSGSTSHSNIIGTSGAGNLIKCKGGVTVNGAINSTIRANTITGSNTSGIRVGGAPTGNTFSQNIIYGNTRLGIDLNASGVVIPNDPGDIDTGSNHLMNFPVINSAQDIGNGTFRVKGTIDFNPSEGPINVEIFKSDNGAYGYGGSTAYLGSISTSDGTWSLDVQVPGDTWSQKMWFTTTATNNLGDTSEFSQNYGIGGSEPQPSYSTCQEKGPTSPPLLYKAVSFSSSSILLSFYPPKGDYTNYMLEYGTKSNKYYFGNSNIGSKPMSSYLVKNLSPGTKYYFRVGARNGCAAGGWSNEWMADGLNIPSFSLPIASEPTPSPSPIPTQVPLPTETTQPISNIGLPSISQIVAFLGARSGFLNGILILVTPLIIVGILPLVSFANFMTDLVDTEVSLKVLMRFLQAVGIIPKGKPQGVVFEANTNNPIPFAIVRVMGVSRKVADTLVSDSSGIYGSIKLEPGRYTLEVKHHLYLFPTAKPKPIALSVKDYYKGEEFEVKEGQDSQDWYFLIPMDARQEEVSRNISLIITQRFLSFLNTIGNILFWPLLLLSAFIFVAHTTFLNGVILGVYVVVYISKIIPRFARQ